MSAILEDIKTDLGSIYSGVTDFDAELINRINSCFPILYQLGVGTNPSFEIATGQEEWSSYISSDYEHLVRKYISLKVKLNFDPPASSTILQALTGELKETEFRLYMKGNGGDGS